MPERNSTSNDLLIADAQRGPRLLVSVRSSDEAIAALQGGADILDVKEPTRGSLGMADSETIAAISRHLRGELNNTSLRLSVALGEVIDWREQHNTPALPQSVSLAKLGLNGLARIDGWQNEWLNVRRRFEQTAHSPFNWVAVAYADFESAASPSINDVLDAAIETECSGLLIDTFSKTGITLLDCCSVSQLNELAERCHAAGMFLALAGRLGRESLAALSRVPVDVIAVRSAACERSDRTAEVSVRAVTSFRKALLSSRPSSRDPLLQSVDS